MLSQAINLGIECVDPPVQLLLDAVDALTQALLDTADSAMEGMEFGSESINQNIRNAPLAAR